jgi:hypothetical protein
VKTKQKQDICGFFVLRIKKSFKYQTALLLFFAVFFIFSEKLSANTSSIVINEIEVAGLTANDEFIELYNTTLKPVDISTWSIQYKGGGGANYYKKNFVSGSVIPARGYFLVAHGGSGNYSGTAAYDMSWSQALSSAGGTIFFVDNQTLLANGSDAAIIDKVGYGVTTEFEILAAIKPAANQSIERKKFQDTNNNNEDFALAASLSPTASGCLENPEKCKIEEVKNDEIAPKKTYPTAINITELFPNPFASQYEEYVELYNGTTEDVDLAGWTLHDASKSGKYTFAQSVILKAQKYLAIFKKDFKFALNNSGNESVTLFDPNGTEVSKAQYDGSKRNVSYNFDGSRWRWSKFLTPGSENILNNEPSGSLKIDKDVFAGVYADFSVSVGDLDGDKVKVTWDFGDKHKSYLSKTRHKYEKEGIYAGSVKLSDGSEDVLNDFMVEVRKYPHPKIRIIAINANPKGADSEKETLTIENKSKKKINLKGWSVATGWKDFINHPIREDFIIAKNKSKEITSKFSSFTLNNAKAKIQLRYPNGKVAHEVKYKSANKTIADGEIYRKVESGWAWVETQKSSVTSHQSSENTNLSPVIENTEIKEVEENKIEETVVPIEIKKEKKIALLNNENIKIELLKTQPQVLGTETVREVSGQYFFTPEISEQEHYAIVFLKNILSGLNSKLNMLLNFFFK